MGRPGDSRVPSWPSVQLTRTAVKALQIGKTSWNYAARVPDKFTNGGAGGAGSAAKKVRDQSWASLLAMSPSCRWLSSGSGRPRDATSRYHCPMMRYLQYELAALVRSSI
jgi:hypothetical protein